MARLYISLSFAALVLLASLPGRAVEYETFIAIESEDDLYDLLVSQQISEDTFYALVELIQHPVELNSASRGDLYSLPNLTLDDVDAILAYRKDAGQIAELPALVAAGVLTASKADALWALSRARTRSTRAFLTEGWLRYQSSQAPTDAQLPTMALQARAAAMDNLTLGISTVVTRYRLGPVVFDPNRHALSAEAEQLRLNVPKLFATWEGNSVGIIFGSYRAGFGERLTFDNTSRYRPQGFYLDDVIYRDDDFIRECRESQGELSESPCADNTFVTPDLRWRDGLIGIAGYFRRPLSGDNALLAYGFASNQARDIYQYAIYDRAVCDDPKKDDDPACAAPQVYRYDAAVLAPTSTFSFTTLPDMFREVTIGGHAEYVASPRARIGITGYGTSIEWLTAGADLDFQEWAGLPSGGPFGAVGASAAWGLGIHDLGMEVARSFDSMNGGGIGAVLSEVMKLPRSELTLTLRYYDDDFANPFSGAISAADEVDGFRARDEAGLRVNYTGILGKRLSLRGLADFWLEPSNATSKLLAYLRADHRLLDKVHLGFSAQFYDKDLEHSAPGECFETSTEEDENGEPLACTGSEVQLAARIRLSLTRRLSAFAQYQHQWLDDPSPDTSRVRNRQDRSGWFLLSIRPTESLTLRARLRYLSEDIHDDTHLEESLWTYLNAAYRAPHRLLINLRYDLYTWLDERESTLLRQPNPEHRFWLKLEKTW